MEATASATPRPLASIRSRSSSGVRVSSWLLASGFTALRPCVLALTAGSTDHWLVGVRASLGDLPEFVPGALVVFPHPALGRGSPPGMHRRPKMKAPQLEHPQFPEDILGGEALRPSRGDLVSCLLGLGVQRLLEPPALWWSCQAHANLPPLGPSRPTPNQSRPSGIPSPRVVLSRGSQRYCGPLRLPGPPPSRGWGEGRDPSPPWVSRVAPCSVPTCHAPYPGERLRGHRSVAPTESGGLPCPKSRSTRTTSLSRLAQVSHVLQPACLCVSARRQVGSPTPPKAAPMSRGLQPYGYPSGPSVAPGVYRQLPRPDLHRQEHSAFHGALSDWG